MPGPGACLRDTRRLDTAALACAQAVEALAGPSALAVSPDGRNVYVAASESNAVVVLARRHGRGLAPPVHPTRRGCIQQSGGFNCASGSPGLAGADAVLASPDGRNVYVGSADAAAVVGFARRSHGLLYPLRPARGKKKLRGASCVHGQEVVAGAAGKCTATFAPLQRVGALAISPDGRFIYALSSGNVSGADTIVVLRRERDGTLTPMPGCVASHTAGGRPRCPRLATGLRGASAIALSPDGRFAYVASAVSSAVSAFQVNRTSGELLPLQGAGACVAEPALSPPLDVPGCAATAEGLGGARTLVVSPDGARVYVGGFDPGSLVVLGRDPQGGGLVAPPPSGATCLQAGTAAGCTVGFDQLRGASAIALSRAGDRVFLAAQGADAALDLALGGGLPTLPLSPFAHFGPLGGPQALALSPDGRNLYLASAADDEVMALGT
ncbi:MAG: beta-propeller fold lactonase family protein, partial [Solirubrobacteraceae bacterium]